ncbi:CLUMA_CG012224, isoform A, partial [Clunio marinus]
SFFTWRLYFIARNFKHFGAIDSERWKKTRINSWNFKIVWIDCCYLFTPSKWNSLSIS